MRFAVLFALAIALSGCAPLYVPPGWHPEPHGPGRPETGDGGFGR